MMEYGGPRKLSSSLQTSRGLCSEGRKCVRKDGHDGKCWPSDEPKEAAGV